MKNDNPNEMRNKPQMEPPHPEEWDADLNPNRLAGQNLGPQTADHDKALRTAYDIKPVHRSLQEFSDDELKQIPVLPEGARLQQGAVYVDLSDPDRNEVRAMGDMSAGRDNYYVPKSDVPYPTWNRLIGVENPERL